MCKSLIIEGFTLRLERRAIDHDRFPSFIHFAAFLKKYCGDLGVNVTHKWGWFLDLFHQPG